MSESANVAENAHTEAISGQENSASPTAGAESLAAATVEPQITASSAVPNYGELAVAQTERAIEQTELAIHQSEVAVEAAIQAVTSQVAAAGQMLQAMSSKLTAINQAAIEATEQSIAKVVASVAAATEQPPSSD